MREIEKGQSSFPPLWPLQDKAPSPTFLWPMQFPFLPTFIYAWGFFEGGGGRGGRGEKFFPGKVLVFLSSAALQLSPLREVGGGSNTARLETKAKANSLGLLAWVGLLLRWNISPKCIRSWHPYTHGNVGSREWDIFWARPGFGLPQLCYSQIRVFSVLPFSRARRV